MPQPPLKDLLSLARPYQYSKNLFVFLPAFFAFQLTNLPAMQNAMLAFIAFCLVASAVYIFNDWIDRFEDAKHPEKCLRPLAAGRVRSSVAFAMLALLLLGGCAAALLISQKAFIILTAYLVFNLAYSLKLSTLPLSI